MTDSSKLVHIVVNPVSEVTLCGVEGPRSYVSSKWITALAPHAICPQCMAALNGDHVQATAA